MKPTPVGSVAVGVALLLVAVMAWLRSDPAETAPAPAAAAPAASADTAPVLAAIQSPPRLAASAPRRESAVLQPAAPSAEVAASAGSAAPPTRVVEFCGVGRMTVPADFDQITLDGLQARPIPLLSDAIDAARPRLFAALRSGSAADQAAAAVLQAWQPPTSPLALAELPAQLFALARQSPETAVLAAAANTCAGWTPGSACAPIARAWIAREPNNAAAWLALEGADPSARDEVLRGLLNSTRHQSHAGWLPAQVQAGMPADVAAYVGMELTVQALGVGFAALVPGMQPVSALCKTATAESDNRRAACQRLMEVMRDHSDTLTGMSMAVALSRFLQRPAAEIEAQRARRNELDRHWDTPFDENEPRGCKSVAQFRQVVESGWQLGEVGRLLQNKSRKAGGAR